MSRKVVYNTCYGGFGLSPEAMKMLFELKNPGKKLYFYIQTDRFRKNPRKVEFKKVVDLTTIQPLEIVYCFTKDFGDTFEYSRDDKEFIKKIWETQVYYGSNIERHDPDLVKVVETLGDKANAVYSKLDIMDIGQSKYHIDDYKGLESVVTILEDDYL